jgi:hypothetical protein
METVSYEGYEDTDRAGNQDEDIVDVGFVDEFEVELLNLTLTHFGLSCVVHL